MRYHAERKCIWTGTFTRIATQQGYPYWFTQLVGRRGHKAFVAAVIREIVDQHLPLQLVRPFDNAAADLADLMARGVGPSGAVGATEPFTHPPR